MRLTFVNPVSRPPPLGPGAIIITVLPMTLPSAWDGSVDHPDPAKFRTNSSGWATWCTIPVTMVAELRMYWWGFAMLYGFCGSIMLSPLTTSVTDPIRPASKCVKLVTAAVPTSVAVMRA